MANTPINKELDKRQAEELMKSLALVDMSVDKKYVSQLSSYSVFEPNFDVVNITIKESKEDETIEEPEADETIEEQSKTNEKKEPKIRREIGSNAKVVELTKFVYDEDENIQDKLMSVYQAVGSFEYAKLFMIIRSDESKQRIYLGVANENDKEPALITEQFSSLERNIVSNFPGTGLKCFNKIEKPENDKGISEQDQTRELLESVFKRKRSVAMVSGIPSIKSEDRKENKQFVQGIEKVLDSIMGETVDILILAEPVPYDELNNIRNGYEEIFSNISPFAKSVINVSKSNSENVTDTITKGITETINESVAKTHTHTLTQGTNSSNTIGGHTGVKIKGVVDLGADYHNTWGSHTDTSDSDGETITEGISNSLNEQNSTSKGLTSGYSDGLQIEYENKSIKSILDKVDLQLKRIKECEDYGMYDCGIYVMGEDYASVIATSSSIKSIMRGKGSSAECSAINAWKYNDESHKIIDNMLAYLSTFNHPVFCLRKDDEMNLPVTSATKISGKELAIAMGFPRKSISGIPVLKTARFGRRVLYIDDSIKRGEDVCVGKIYHMNRVEDTEVNLNSASFPSHIFITGSTGSGKSTTVYKLLDQTMNDVSECKFLIVEPAKGEYKTVFGGRRDVTVYGTNLNEVDKIIRLNPFSFPEKIHILEHIDKIIGIFNACWPMYAAMPAILKESIERAYIKAGWDLARSVNLYEKEFGVMIYPSFSDVLCEIKSIIEESQYSSDSKGDYTGALVTRLKTLTNGINGLIFTSDETNSNDLFEKNVIIDLSRITADETKSLIMGILLIKQQEYRVSTRTKKNAELRHITVLEEAHNILKRTSTEQSSEGANLVGKSVEMISNAIAEMRTYGECFIIVDQSPSAVDMSAVRNTNTKIIMRLPDASDRELIGKSAGLNEEQIAELSKLKTGVAAIYQNNWVEPILCAIDGESVKEQEYVLPNGYESDWAGDEDIVKEVVDAMLVPFLEKNNTSSTKLYKNITRHFVKKVLNSGLDADTKVKFYDFYKASDESAKINISENVIYNLLFNDDVWKKSLAYRNNISEWYRQMEMNIRPDISDMEKNAIDVIMQILAYKQGQMCKDEKKVEGLKDANGILEELLKKAKGSGLDV